VVRYVPGDANTIDLATSEGRWNVNAFVAQRHSIIDVGAAEGRHRRELENKRGGEESAQSQHANSAL
jgi:hypothetical protein